MKRQGDIATIEEIEKRITANSHHKLMGDSGANGEYDKMTADRSAYFGRHYRIECNRYYAIKGYFNVKLRFDYRNGTGKVEIGDWEVAALCSVTPDMGQLVFSLTRMSEIRRNGNNASIS